MSKEYELIREKALLTDEEIYQSYAHMSQPRSHPAVHRAIAKTQVDKLLKLVRIEADSQEPPRPNIDIHIWRDYTPDMAYEKAQQDMRDIGFVRCLSKEEK